MNAEEKIGKEDTWRHAALPKESRSIERVTPVYRWDTFDLKPESHIAIIFDRNRKRSVGPDNNPREFPDPHGMSGSPIWLLYDEQGPNDPEQMHVVGIAIEHRKELRAIVATDIGEALALINDAT